MTTPVLTLSPEAVEEDGVFCHPYLLRCDFALVADQDLLPLPHFEQNPQNSRRNLLPMKCINRSLLMGHEHVSRALVELRQIRKTPSSADRVLHDAPEAFDRIEVMPTMGR